MKKIVQRGLLLALVCLLAGLVFVLLRTPSLTRQWDEDVRVLAGVETDQNGLITLTNVRDWTYSQDSVLTKTYFDETYDPERIVDLWMYEQILDDSGYIAHTFLVFEFDEDYPSPARYLGISVETRREEGELYSVIGGALRTFEVTHIWATERDLVRRRVVHLDYPLTRLRLDVSPEFRSRLFSKLALETALLAETPVWYNTATNNCTSSLIRYANESQPGAIPLHYSYVFTGKVDDYLKTLGYLDTGYALAVTRSYLESNDVR